MRQLNLFEGWWERFDKGDIAGMMDLAAPDIECVIPGMRLQGWEQLAPLLHELHAALPDMRHRLVRYLESEGAATVELILTGTMTGPLQTPHGMAPPTGKQLNLRACDVVTVRDNRFPSMRSYYDTVEFMTQLGLMPSPAG